MVGRTRDVQRNVLTDPGSIPYTPRAPAYQKCHRFCRAMCSQPRRNSRECLAVLVDIPGARLDTDPDKVRIRGAICRLHRRSSSLDCWAFIATGSLWASCGTRKCRCGNHARCGRFVAEVLQVAMAHDLRYFVSVPLSGIDIGTQSDKLASTMMLLSGG